MIMMDDIKEMRDFKEMNEGMKCTKQRKSGKAKCSESVIDEWILSQKT